MLRQKITKLGGHSLGYGTVRRDVDRRMWFVTGDIAAITAELGEQIAGFLAECLAKLRVRQEGYVEVVGSARSENRDLSDFACIHLWQLLARATQSIM